MRTPIVARTLLLASVSLVVGVATAGCDDNKATAVASKADPHAGHGTDAKAGAAKAADAKGKDAHAHHAAAGKVKAHQANFKAAAAPADAWTIDTDATKVSFVIVSNSAGPVTGHFDKAAKGWLAKDGKSGQATVDLIQLRSVDKTGAENAVRDARVVHAFFGLPLDAAPKDKAEVSKGAMGAIDKVNAVWKKLDGVLPTGVAQAAYKLQGVDGLDKLEDGKPGDIMTHGSLVLWDSLEVHVMFPMTATKKGKTLTASSKKAVSINLEELLGKATRDTVFDTMLAAGCGHQAGIQSKVDITIDQLTLTMK